jgi:hypothetical protein
MPRDRRLEARNPPELLYRLGRNPDAWQLPDWSRVNPDGTFNNRFDDPESHYRVLYASTQELGCYIECLAHFRPDLSLLAELNEIDGENDFMPLGTLPADWFPPRVIGSAKVFGDYADIYSVEWVNFLRRRLASLCVQLGIDDLDSGVLQRGSPRIITQRASLEAYIQDFAGIYYRSRYGHNLENWALFEPLHFEPEAQRPVTATDPALTKALSILGIRLG